MNNVIIFHKIYISNRFGKSEALSVTNGVVIFNGYEKLASFKKTEDNETKKHYRYCNYNFHAYDAVAERIQKMNIRAGSIVHITGEMNQYIDENKKRVYFVVVKDIDFVQGDDVKSDMQSEKCGKVQNEHILEQTDMFSIKGISDDELAC